MRIFERDGMPVRETMTSNQRAFLGSAVAGAIYISVLFLIVLFARDIPDQPAIGSNIKSIMSPPNAHSYQDPLYFANGALDLYYYGWFRQENLYLIRLWPPGFMMLQAALLHLFGVDAPIVLLLGGLSAVLFAAVLMVARRYLALYLSVSLASGIPLLIFSIPLVRLFVLEPIGLVFGEAFSIGFFLIALALIAISGHSRSKVAAASAGICFGLAAYFRSQYELLVNFLTLFAFAWFFIAITTRFVWRRSHQHRLGTSVSLALIAVLFAQLVMLPWRVFNLLDPNVRSLAWVQTQHLEYRNNGMTDEQLYKINAGWIVQGGGNLGCKIDAKYCGRSDARSFYSSFMQNFIDWYRQKIPVWKKYWFSSNLNFAGTGGASSTTEFTANVIFLVCLFAIWPLLWLSRQSPEAQMLVWFTMSQQVAFFLLLTFVHLETRYLYLLKIESLFTALLLIGPLVNTYCRRRGSKLSFER
jgi:hypothetical protein